MSADGATPGAATPGPGLPAWSEPFSGGRAGLRRIAPLDGIDPIDRPWAFGSGDGEGIVVAIVDSGVEGSHPAVAGRLRRSVRVELSSDEATVVDDEPVDAVGHGTACAGIVVGLAPHVTILSVRVLGADNRGKGVAFARGLEWAIE